MSGYWEPIYIRGLSGMGGFETLSPRLNRESHERAVPEDACSVWCRQRAGFALNFS
jgi:hypothetical protein